MGGKRHQNAGKGGKGSPDKKPPAGKPAAKKSAKKAAKKAA